MSKINTIIIGLLGVGCFSAGVYYATLQFDKQVNVWDSNYQIITDKVYAFEKVSDPKTIRLYVKELHAILDNIHFLSKIVESGQIADNTLDLFIDKHQKKIDNVSNRILELNTQHNELVFKFKEQVTRLTGETDDNLELIQGLQEKIQEQNDYVNKLNVEIGQSVKQLEDNVQTIKSSKYGNKIWKIKKRKIK